MESCPFCSKELSRKEVPVEVQFNGTTITENKNVLFCETCKETFFSSEDLIKDKYVKKSS